MNPDPKHTAREVLLAFADRLAAEDIPTQDGCVQFAREVAEECPGGAYGPTVLALADSPKMLRETFAVAQTHVGLSGLPRAAEHVARLQRLIDECDRHRPLGPDGKHGERHTPTCGCERPGTGPNDYLEPCGCLSVREVTPDGTLWVPYPCREHETPVPHRTERGDR